MMASASAEDSLLLVGLPSEVVGPATGILGLTVVSKEGGRLWHCRKCRHLRRSGRPDLARRRLDSGNQWKTVTRTTADLLDAFTACAGAIHFYRFELFAINKTTDIGSRGRFRSFLFETRTFRSVFREDAIVPQQVLGTMASNRLPTNAHG